MTQPESFALRLGRHLRLHRRVKDRSQEALAARIGCNRRYVSVIERGEARLSVELFVGYCEALGLDPAEVLAAFLRRAREDAEPSP